MKLWKKTLLIILTSLIIVSVGFYIYTLDYYHTFSIFQEVLDKTNIDYKKNEDTIIFNPKNNNTEKGIIFYSGGKVDYTSYIPLREKIAKEVYTYVLVKMPF